MPEPTTRSTPGAGGGAGDLIQRLRDWPATHGQGDAFEAGFVHGLMLEAADALAAAPAAGVGAVPTGNDRLRELLEPHRARLFEPWDATRASDPDQPQAYRYGDQGRVAISLTNAEARRILAAAPHPPGDTGTGSGRGAGGLGRLNEAITGLDDLLHQDPFHWIAHRDRARALVRQARALVPRTSAPPCENRYDASETVTNAGAPAETITDLAEAYTPALFYYPEDDRLELVTADVATVARYVVDGCALLSDMTTRAPVGFYIERAAARLPKLISPAARASTPPAPVGQEEIADEINACRRRARAILALNDPRSVAPSGETGGDFQARNAAWMGRCFEGDPTDLAERRDRFVEESLELGQSLGGTREDAHRLVDYVFDRPKGHPAGEFGGMLTTAACLAAFTGHDMMACGEAELARISTPAFIGKLRGKRATRHGRGPLPGYSAPGTSEPTAPPPLVSRPGQDEEVRS